MTTLSRKQREQAGTAVLYALTAASFALLFVLASCREAPAQSVVHTQCQFGKRDAVCSTAIIDPGAFKPHIQYVPQPTIGSEADKAQQERIRAWEERCVSHIEVDDLGVRRYRYKYEGCEFDR
jgi:hypothetical protein